MLSSNHTLTVLSTVNTYFCVAIPICKNLNYLSLIPTHLAYSYAEWN